LAYKINLEVATTLTNEVRWAISDKNNIPLLFINMSKLYYIASVEAGQCNRKLVTLSINKYQS